MSILPDAERQEDVTKRTERRSMMAAFDTSAAA
jgi:hypothetical protein